MPKTANPVPVLSDNAPNKLAEENELVPKIVALPTEVMAPVRLALVVTVPALPMVLIDPRSAVAVPPVMLKILPAMEGLSWTIPVREFTAVTAALVQTGSQMVPL